MADFRRVCNRACVPDCQTPTGHHDKLHSSSVLLSKVRLPGVTHSKFPSPANDYIEDQIDLNRELVPSPMSPGSWLSCWS